MAVVSREQKISYLWEIKNLGDYKFKTGEYINSSRFYTDDSILKSDWKLRLYPGGHDKEHLNMTVALLPLSKFELTVNSVISIVDSEREKVATLFSESPAPIENIFHSVHLDPQGIQLKRAIYNGTLSILCEMKLFKTLSDIEEIQTTPELEVRMWSVTEFKTLDTVTNVHVTENRQTAFLPYGQTFIHIQYYMPDPNTLSMKLMDHSEVDKLWCSIVVKSKYINKDTENIIEKDCFIDGKFSIKLQQATPFPFNEKLLLQSVNPSPFSFCSTPSIAQNATTFPNVNATISIKFLSISLKDSFAYDFSTPRQQLMADFKNFFLEANSCDISINVGGKTLWAHKHVLMARSTVFATMFATDMLESNTNTVTITDFSFEAIHAMLKYIYFGITDQEANHVELFKTAARYELKILQRNCELLLCDDVNMNNATGLLLLTESYYAPMLKFSVLSCLRGSSFHQYNWIFLIKSFNFEVTFIFFFF